MVAVLPAQLGEALEEVEGLHDLPVLAKRAKKLKNRSRKG